MGRECKLSLEVDPNRVGRLKGERRRRCESINHRGADFQYAVMFVYLGLDSPIDVDAIRFSACEASVCVLDLSF